MFLLCFEGRADGKGFHQVCVLDADDEEAAVGVLNRYLVKINATFVEVDPEESRRVNYETVSPQLRANHSREDGVMAMSGRIYFEGQ